jgi:hypothetical protein
MVSGNGNAEPDTKFSRPLTTIETIDLQVLGALFYADQYGKGDRGVVLAHGGRFNKESWGNQAVVAGRGGISRLGNRFPR